MEFKMKNIVNKITTMLLVITLLMGVSMNTNLVYADEFDGDRMENPWADLFQGDDKPIKVIIDDTSDKKTPQITKNDVKKALKTSIKSATKKNKKSRTAKIVLKKVTKIKGVRYQIKYAANKKFKKAKIKNYKKNKITLKRLKANKKYYVKARAYTSISKGKKVYGKWTKRKVIRVKKKK